MNWNYNGVITVQAYKSGIGIQTYGHQGGKLVGWGGGVINWEIGIDIYTWICIKWITNKNLLYKKINKIKFKKKKSGIGLSLRIWSQTHPCTTENLNFLWTVPEPWTPWGIFRIIPASCKLMVISSPLVTMQPFRTPNQSSLNKHPYFLPAPVIILDKQLM